MTDGQNVFVFSSTKQIILRHFSLSLSLNKGGSGRRKLTVIPPEAEGYSVKALRAASAGSKATFYIVPLQETLDTSPLPPDSEHFSKMPKTTCYQCNEMLPLHMLAVHIKTCKGKFTSDESGEEVRASLFV